MTPAKRVQTHLRHTLTNTRAALKTFLASGETAAAQAATLDPWYAARFLHTRLADTPLPDLPTEVGILHERLLDVQSAAEQIDTFSALETSDIYKNLITGQLHVRLRDHVDALRIAIPRAQAHMPHAVDLPFGEWPADELAWLRLRDQMESRLFKRILRKDNLLNHRKKIALHIQVLAMVHAAIPNASSTFLTHVLPCYNMHIRWRVLSETILEMLDTTALPHDKPIRKSLARVQQDSGRDVKAQVIEFSEYTTV